MEITLATSSGGEPICRICSPISYVSSASSAYCSNSSLFYIKLSNIKYKAK